MGLFNKKTADVVSRTTQQQYAVRALEHQAEYAKQLEESRLAQERQSLHQDAYEAQRKRAEQAQLQYEEILERLSKVVAHWESLADRVEILISKIDPENHKS